MFTSEADLFSELSPGFGFWLLDSTSLVNDDPGVPLLGGCFDVSSKNGIETDGLCKTGSVRAFWEDGGGADF